MPQPKSAPTKPPLDLPPYVQTALAFGAMGITMTVVGALIFGTPEQSERAFRLLELLDRIKSRSA